MCSLRVLSAEPLLPILMSWENNREDAPLSRGKLRRRHGAIRGCPAKIRTRRKDSFFAPGIAIEETGLNVFRGIGLDAHGRTIGLHGKK